MKDLNAGIMNFFSPPFREGKGEEWIGKERKGIEWIKWVRPNGGVKDNVIQGRGRFCRGLEGQDRRGGEGGKIGNWKAGGGTSGGREKVEMEGGGDILFE